MLLDQRLFNGVGNYLRAEILDCAGVLPFESARAALERARDAEAMGAAEADGAASSVGAAGGVDAAGGVGALGGGRRRPDLLAAVRAILRQAVSDKGRDWLRVYGKRYASKETDGLGRAVWYRGERGPLPPTLYAHDGAWTSLFVARLPEQLDRTTLRTLCAATPNPNPARSAGA